MFISEKREKVFGWGRSTYSNSSVYSCTTINDIHEVVKIATEHGYKISCRGAGRSYGDNTLNDNQIVLDLSRMIEISSWDPTTGIITAEAGASIEKILLHCVPSGWVFPAMPGTRFVTLAGALGNNIHGKNALHRGCIGEHVQSFKVILADNKLYNCSRAENIGLFYSVISGLGLLGIIVEVSLQLKKISSYYVDGKASVHNNFSELVEAYEKIKDKYEYSIAWVDAIKKGENIGRGEINYANFLEDGDYAIRDHKIPKNLFGLIPNDLVPYVAKIFLNTQTMRIVNSLQMKTGNMSSDVQGKKVSLSKYHYLMDMKFPKYNYFFRHGFFLYQPILPTENSINGFQDLLKITHKYGFYSVMSAFKAYRQQKEEFLLPFPLDGYSMTMDIPKSSRRIKEQVKMFYEMNDCVIKYGGRIYLGKTPVLNADQFYAMYPKLDEFLSVKGKIDPTSLFESNMYRRIMDINYKDLRAPSIYSI